MDATIPQKKIGFQPRERRNPIFYFLIELSKSKL